MLTKGEVITDKMVFDEGWVPEDIKHRRSELSMFSTALKSGLEGFDCIITVYGPPGVGKTLSIKHVLEQLDTGTDDADAVYVNCWINNKPFDTLERILDGLDTTVDIHRQSTAQSTLYQRITDAIDRPCVIALDEVDRLKDKDLLYKLHAIDGVSIVTISNRPQDLFSRLDDRITSRFQGSTNIHFGEYSTGALTEILRDRVKAGVRDDAITRKQIEQIAAVCDDARTAIDALHKTVERADRDGRSVTDEDVQVAIETAGTTPRYSTEGLTEHERSLLVLIHAADTEISSSDLHEQYEHRWGDDALTKRQRRNILVKLQEYNYLEKTGNTRWTKYRSLLPEDETIV
ncbi:Cdc6/Cdc18 family protein [Natrononativus amylolyticus]|uniref:Cdc6/Cdc18 family protein n=1 Tax=Natrononativus amylolyticus TaxID=2963434 RepID=UPI0020CCBB3B|nr:Cdc6/Cdc18 family protein [Natrononativus amylolyticus]